MPDQQLMSSLQSVNDPEIGRSIVDLQMVASAEQGNPSRVTIELPAHAYPQPERLRTAIEQAVEGPVEVEFTHRVRGKESGGSLGLRIKNIIAVGSGKGGVGKSTIAACLAYGLKNAGSSVGLMDADVYGPSIPHLLGASDVGQPQVKQVPLADGKLMERMVPADRDGIKLMSMGFMVREDQAVIWRGPMLHKALMQFLQQTDWGELDYLVIDLPPGTGDVSLTLSQSVGLAGAVIVCTPQKVALLDAVKAISMYRQVKIPILGMVENMSGEVFGRGGAAARAQETGIPFLGEIPSDASVRIRGDEGRIGELFAEDSPVRQPLVHMTQRTAMEIAKQLLEQPSMPTLEIL